VQISFLPSACKNHFFFLRVSCSETGCKTTTFFDISKCFLKIILFNF